jgi:hypothetical protein
MDRDIAGTVSNGVAPDSKVAVILLTENSHNGSVPNVFSLPATTDRSVAAQPELNTDQHFQPLSRALHICHLVPAWSQIPRRREARGHNLRGSNGLFVVGLTGFEPATT